MKIGRVLMCLVVSLFVAMFIGWGCSRSGTEQPVQLMDDLETTGSAEEPTVTPPSAGEEEFAVSEFKLVLPNGDEVDTDSKRISRYAKIKILYAGERDSDPELTSGGNSIDFTEVSDQNGELLIKPNLPLHHMTPYQIAIGGNSQSFTVQRPGDVDGDGLSDFVAGAPDYTDGPFTGYAYLFYGNENLHYSGIPDSGEVWIHAKNPGSYEVGKALALGDINGDGYADIIVGAPGAIGDRGALVVLSGGPDVRGLQEFDIQQNIGAVSRVNGSTQSKFARALATGDVDGDGFEDVIVGAPIAKEADNDDSSTFSSGAAHVFFGGANGIGRRDLDGQDNGDISFSTTTQFQYAGTGVAAADINGDGKDDVIIGAPQSTPGNGNVYIIMGADRAELLDSGDGDSHYDASSVDKVIPAPPGINRFGTSVAAVTNPNQDGLLIGAQGHAYRYSQTGGLLQIDQPITLSTFDAIVGWSGNNVIVGDYDASKVWINLGGNTWRPAIIGDNGSSRLGISISPAGDLNGDDNPDYVVGEDKGPVNERGRIHVNLGAEDEEVYGCMTGSADGHFGAAVAGGRVR